MIDKVVAGGNSGGPVVNQAGQFVAVIQTGAERYDESDERVPSAIPMAALRHILERSDGMLTDD